MTGKEADSSKQEAKRIKAPVSLPIAQVPVRIPWRAHLIIACGFVIAYTTIGFVGLTLQSAQAGVTPVWPASGVAFALTYWFGYRYALLVMPGMLVLAWLIGVPIPVALLAGVGGVLEVLVAVWMLRRFKVNPSLMQLRDTLLFVSLAAGLGALFSAGLGALSMMLFTPGLVEARYIIPMWWLGNSLGILIVGGLGLVLPGQKTFPLYGRRWTELLGLCLIALILTWFSIERVAHIASALILYLLVPLIVLAGLRMGQFGVLTVAVMVLFTMMVANGQLPNEQLGSHGLGLLYLNISLVWMATFTGLIVGSAGQERRQREEVSWLASHDALTDLVNRHEFDVRLQRALATAHQHDHCHAVLFIDLDRFKRINDTEGHAAGDAVLRDVARLLHKEVRGRDTVSRSGGDEFALLLESCPLSEACGIAENIRRVLEDYVYHGAHGHYSVAASIGVVEIDAASSDSRAVLHGADLACYEAKRSGRNRVCVGAATAPEAATG